MDLLPQLTAAALFEVCPRAVGGRLCSPYPQLHPATLDVCLWLSKAKAGTHRTLIS